MIKRIFQDLDECILHTYVNSMPPTEYVEFILGEDMHTYRTMIRPCAKRLFEYYNSVVGKENVYILTHFVKHLLQSIMIAHINLIRINVNVFYLTCKL